MRDDVTMRVRRASAAVGRSAVAVERAGSGFGSPTTRFRPTSRLERGWGVMWADSSIKRAVCTRDHGRGNPELAANKARREAEKP